MKVSELSGALLDYWVARALGYSSVQDLERRSGLCIVDGDGYQTKDWSPSRDWTQGGPIIERERIMIVPAGYNGDPEHEWMAGDEECWTKFRQPRWRGPTPLVAAMRAFVSRKFGDEVEDLPRDTN